MPAITQNNAENINDNTYYIKICDRRHIGPPGNGQKGRMHKAHYYDSKKDAVMQKKMHDHPE